MPRWLTAAMLLVSAHAWTPRTSPSTPQTNTTRLLHVSGWDLELRENRAIRSPYYKQCQFYTGRVLYQDRSSATITECDGQVYGLLEVGEQVYVLQPTRAGRHVVHRRDVVWSEQPTLFNLTGDTVDNLELDLESDDEPVPHVRPRHTAHSDHEYYRDVRPVTRPVSGVFTNIW